VSTVVPSEPLQAKHIEMHQRNAKQATISSCPYRPLSLLAFFAQYFRRGNARLLQPAGPRSPRSDTADEGATPGRTLDCEPPRGNQQHFPGRKTGQEQNPRIYRSARIWNRNHVRSTSQRHGIEQREDRQSTTVPAPASGGITSGMDIHALHTPIPFAPDRGTGNLCQVLAPKLNSNARFL